MNTLTAVPAGARPIVGMIHLAPLPGAPNANGRSIGSIATAAIEDARRLQEGGIDVLLLQNANDHPPRSRVPKTTAAAYAVVAAAVRRASDLPLGISVLKSDPESSFAVALAADAQYVRLKSYVGVEVGAEGLVGGCAADAVRLRRELGARDRIEIWADAVQPTSRPLAPVAPAELVAWCATFGLADRVIVTGRSLDESLAIIEAARPAVRSPLLVGGGVAPDQAAEVLRSADGLIVGRYLRAQSLTGAIDLDRVREFVAAARSRDGP